jgi:hypothetical protein
LLSLSLSLSSSSCGCPSAVVVFFFFSLSHSLVWPALCPIFLIGKRWCVSKFSDGLSTIHRDHHKSLLSARCR